MNTKECFVLNFGEVRIHRLGGSCVNFKMNNYFIEFLHRLDRLSHSVTGQTVLCCFWQ